MSEARSAEFASPPRRLAPRAALGASEGPRVYAPPATRPPRPDRTRPRCRPTSALPGST